MELSSKIKNSFLLSLFKTKEEQDQVQWRLFSSNPEFRGPHPHQEVDYMGRFMETGTFAYLLSAKSSVWYAGVWGKTSCAGIVGREVPWHPLKVSDSTETKRNISRQNTNNSHKH